MPVSLQVDINNLLWSTALCMVVTGVAVTVSKVMLSNPIPWEKKKPLVDKYGAWAVNIAESVCPHNDVTCVEREAKRLYETRIRRAA